MIESATAESIVRSVYKVIHNSCDNVEFINVSFIWNDWVVLKIVFPELRITLCSSQVDVFLGFTCAACCSFSCAKHCCLNYFVMCHIWIRIFKLKNSIESKNFRKFLVSKFLGYFTYLMRIVGMPRTVIVSNFLALHCRFSLVKTDELRVRYLCLADSWIPFDQLHCKRKKVS